MKKRSNYLTSILLPSIFCLVLLFSIAVLKSNKVYADDNVIYHTSFEDDIELNGWNNFDDDGDGHSWFTEAFGYTGSYAMCSESYDYEAEVSLTPDNKLLSPAITIPSSGATLAFYARGLETDYDQEHFKVYALYGEEYETEVCLSGDEDIITSGKYTPYFFDLDNFAGKTIKIYIRHCNVYDQSYLILDDFYVFRETPSVYFDPNGGTADYTELHLFPEEELMYLPHVYREGYIFAGWYDENDSIVQANYDFYPNEECILTAKWIKAPATLIKGFYFNSLEELDNWTVYDSDNDSFNWYWTDYAYKSFDGNGKIYSESFHDGNILTPDNWTLTPKVKLADKNLSLSLWAAAQDNKYPDTFRIYIGLTDTLEDMKPLTEDIIVSSSGNYTQYTCDIPDEYAGKEVYIAIRHYNCADEYVLCIDNLEIFGDKNETKPDDSTTPSTDDGKSSASETKADGPEKGKTIKDKKYIYKVVIAGSSDGSIIGELTVIGLKKKSLTTIKIAAKVTINGITYKVTSVGKNAFKNNKKIIKAFIGKNVKIIKTSAFEGCKKLKQVSINSKLLKTIGKNAFNGDKKLKKIIIKSKKLKMIGNKALKGTSKKLVVRVPKKKKKEYRKKLKKAGNKKVKVKA